jgi:hypothetical protein
MYPEDISFVRQMAIDLIEASRVRPGESVGAYGPNTTGGTLIRPGGRDCYPAFWIRDYAMSLGCGAITLEEQEHALLLTARLQADSDHRTRSGGQILRGSIADHITFDGLPIFYPGTLDDYEGQGGPWGPLPPFDNAFFFVYMAWWLAIRYGRKDLLTASVNGLSLAERLHLAFDSVPADPQTGLVKCTRANRGVSFGFMDTVYHTGKLLFASLLKWRAARWMEEISHFQDDGERAQRYRRIYQQIQECLPATFSHPCGLLRASTGISSQPDAWGSTFAVYCGLLPWQESHRLSQVLADLYRQGRLAWNGAIRHVPVGMDFSEESCWERVVGGFKHNTYQNGAYWSTPTGWVIYALDQVDQEAAHQLAEEYITELQGGDYRKGEAFGSPWECAHSDGEHRQNPVYMASVTAVLPELLYLAHDD